MLVTKIVYLPSNECEHEVFKFNLFQIRRFKISTDYSQIYSDCNYLV